VERAEPGALRGGLPSPSRLECFMARAAAAKEGSGVAARRPRDVASTRRRLLHARTARRAARGWGGAAEGLQGPRPSALATAPAREDLCAQSVFPDKGRGAPSRAPPAPATRTFAPRPSLSSAKQRCAALLPRRVGACAAALALTR
jgi:hypothetical protein